jgi:acetolactate synthase regulatory subunit
MSGLIEVDFVMAEGAVTRMLGLVERRGFEVRAIAMAERTAGRGSLSLEVRPRGSNRSLDIVAGHLRSLHEVRHVSCSTPASGVTQ